MRAASRSAHSSAAAAVTGPAARMLDAHGRRDEPRHVAGVYGELIDELVIDESTRRTAGGGLPVVTRRA